MLRARVREVRRRMEGIKRRERRVGVCRSSRGGRGVEDIASGDWLCMLVGMDGSFD